MLSQTQGEDFTWGKTHVNIACNKKEKRNTDKNKADLSQKILGFKAFHVVQQVIYLLLNFERERERKSILGSFLFFFSKDIFVASCNMEELL